MRKADIITVIADRTGIPKVDILVTLETFIKVVKETVVESEGVHLRGFGTFTYKKRAAKKGRNIKKNEIVYIPEHYIPTFKPAKEFVAAVKSVPVKESKGNENS